MNFGELALPQALPLPLPLPPPRHVPSRPAPPPGLQMAKVKNQLGYEEKSGAGLSDQISAKEAELEREQEALQAARKQEAKHAKENEAVQVRQAPGGRKGLGWVSGGGDGASVWWWLCGGPEGERGGGPREPGPCRRPCTGTPQKAPVPAPTRPKHTHAPTHPPATSTTHLPRVR